MDRMKFYKLMFYFFSFGLILVLSAAVNAEDVKKGTSIDKISRVVVATINGEKIYKDQLLPYIEKQINTFKKQRDRALADDLVVKIYEAELERIIGHELLVQASKTVEVKNIDKEVNSQIEMFKKRYPTEDLYNAYVLNRYKNDDALRKFLAQDILLKKYLNKMNLLKPEVPEKELKELYESRKASFISDESVRVSHIIIFVKEDATPEEEKKAGEKAKEVMAKLKKGAKFEDLAIKFSEDKFAEKGGDLGFITKGYLPVKAEEVAFSMEAGKVSDILKTSVGYQILKVFEKKPKEQMPFEKVRGVLVRYLQPKISKEKIASHIRDLREKAEIEINRENFKL